MRYGETLPGAAPIRTLVVEDHEAWRRFFSTALQGEPELQVVAEVSDGLQAVQKAEELQPDLILLDIGLPSLNGIEAACRIRKISPASKILFVSENRSLDIAEKALSTGACGYVVKSDANKELLPAIGTILEGKQFISASLSLQGIVTLDTRGSEDRDRIENDPYLHFGRSALISEFLASTIEATAADFGNVQLFDSTNQVLRIVAHHGFESEFLSYFGTVGLNDKCACGRAMNGRSRIVVTDVASDPLYSNDSRGVMLRAKVRSLQSTPLIGSGGKFLGMVSTHYKDQGRPLPHMWKRVDDLAASFLASINA
jgi:CheY-like chemotaxis protein